MKSELRHGNQKREAVSLQPFEVVNRSLFLVSVFEFDEWRQCEVARNRVVTADGDRRSTFEDNADSAGRFRPNSIA